jgi:hypothetical protein
MQINVLFTFSSRCILGTRYLKDPLFSVRGESRVPSAVQWYGTPIWRWGGYVASISRFQSHYTCIREAREHSMCRRRPNHCCDGPSTPSCVHNEAVCYFLEEVILCGERLATCARRSRQSCPSIEDHEKNMDATLVTWCYQVPPWLTPQRPPSIIDPTYHMSSDFKL